jgi:hypothetical protein
MPAAALVPGMRHRGQRSADQHAGVVRSARSSWPRAARLDALDETGWFRDRYSQCIRRDWIIVVHLNGVPTGDVTAEVTMLGYGSNGTREIRYVVFVEDIKKNLAPNLILETVQIQASFAGCSAPQVDCPPVTARDVPVTAWRLQEDWSISFTSPDVAGCGEQRVPQSLYLRMWAYSLQPNYVWTPPVDFGTSRSRYDSAPYVGATKGAVFPEYQMVFTVDLNDPTQHVGRDLVENSYYKVNRVLDRDQFLGTRRPLTV